MKKILAMALMLVGVCVCSAEMDILASVGCVEDWISKTYEKDSVAFDVGVEKLKKIAKSEKSDTDKIVELKAEFPKAFDEKSACSANNGEQERAKTIYELGLMYYNQQDFDEAVKMFKLASEQGYAEAQFSLGACYVLGRGVQKDTVAATAWYKKSADQGFAKAQYCLAGMLISNNDKDNAVMWLTKASEQGLAEAQEALKKVTKK